MRFILFDRIVELKKGHGAVLLKNVSQCEDYFTDHFPGFPVVPGSIILGSFEQGSEILLGASCDFLLRPVLPWWRRSCLLFWLRRGFFELCELPFELGIGATDVEQNQE